MTRLTLYRDPNRLNNFLAPWNHFFRDFDNFFQDFDRMLEPGLGINKTLGEWQTNYEIKETDKGYLMSFDLPGVKQDQINIELNGDRLVITAERQAKNEDEGDGHYFVQRSYGRFQRAFTLPEGVRKDQIEANLEDGVLYLMIPKAEQIAAKKIKIGEQKGGFLKRMMGKKADDAKEKIAQAL